MPCSWPTCCRRPGWQLEHSRVAQAHLSEEERDRAGQNKGLQLVAWHVLILLAYLLLTLFMTWPLVAHWSTAIPGDSFDGWQNYWNLWWTKLALVDGLRSPFTTDLLYFPTGVNLYFHTLNVFNGVWSLPIQLPWGLIPAYNAVVLFSFTLAGYGAFLLTRWAIGMKAGVAPMLAAFLAGLIFTFAPFHMAHLLGHMQVLSYEWLPFYALALLHAMSQRQARRSWLRPALLAALFLTLAALCDWYFALYLALFTALATFFWRSPHLVRARSIWLRMRQNAVVALVVGCGGVLLLSPLLVPMLREAAAFNFMVRPAQDQFILSASLADFLIPNRLHTLFRPDSFAWVGNQIAPVSERTIAVGYVALALAVVALVTARQRAIFWASCALFFLLMALGPAIHLGDITWASIPANPTLDGWTPYALVNWLTPFMRISRSVSRFALMVQLSVAVLAGVGAYFALARIERRRAYSQARLSIFLTAALMGGMLLAEYWVAPYPLSPPDTPDYYERLANEPIEPHAPALLNLPMNYDRPGYLLYQTIHRRPLTVAYISRDDPRTFTERAPVLQHFRHLGPDIVDVDPARVGATVLADLGVGIVVLDRYKMPGGKEREYTEQLASEIFAGQSPMFEDERVTVYRTTIPANPEPYLSLGPLHWGSAIKDEDGAVVGRAVGAEPAAITVHHAQGGVSLRIRYRSSAPVDVLDDAGQVIVRLPVTPQSSQTIIPLGERREIRLRAPHTSGAVIEKIGLVDQD